MVPETPPEKWHILYRLPDSSPAFTHDFIFASLTRKKGVTDVQSIPADSSGT